LIINIRGTNGSGKSTVVREVMASCSPAVPIFGLLGLKIPEAYALRRAPNWYVIGPYVTPTGGCDVVGSTDKVLVLLEKYLRRGSLVFEGAMLSDHIGTVGTWLEAQSDVVVAYMTTPLDECVRRVVARRQQSGNNGSFNPEKTLRPRQKPIDRTRAVFSERGHVRVVDLSIGAPTQDVLKIMRAQHAAE
jgi:hypothetical protein